MVTSTSSFLGLRHRIKPALVSAWRFAVGTQFFVAAICGLLSMLRHPLLAQSDAGAATRSEALGPPSAPNLYGPPPKVAGYVLADSQRATDSSIGSRYRYKKPDAPVIDAFVYPGRRYEARDAKSILREEAEDFERALPVLQAKGFFQAYKVAVAAPDSIASVGGWIQGYLVVVPIRRDGAVAVMFCYFYAVPGGVLKVRTDVPKDSWQTSDVLVFTRELAERMAGAE